MDNLNETWEKEAEKFANATESIQTPLEPLSNSDAPTLGKAQRFLEDARPLMADIGWKTIPLDQLPSRGMFYPEGTQIAIRAASVGEIRHWSTIDENDLLAMDDMINYVIEKCIQIKIPGTVTNWKDIKEIDRLYLIFAIREYTFKEGENNIYVNTEDGDKIKVTKDMIAYFEIDEKLHRFYNAERKCFSFELKTGEKFDLYMPSIGVTSFIKAYIKSRQQQGFNVDTSFIKFASFLFPEYRSMTQAIYEKAVQNSSTWSLPQLSLMTNVVDMLAAGVNPKVTYTTPGGAEMTAPLNFQGGLKSLFIISDIFDQLV